MRALYIIISAFSLSGCVSIDEQLIPRDEALSILLETETFSGPAVGYAGAVPSQVCAFHALLVEPDAVELFAEVRRRARPAGQLYGLCGLYLTDIDQLDRVIEPYLEKNDEVWTFFGCIMKTESIDTLAADIASGMWPEAFRDVDDACSDTNHSGGITDE